MKSYKGFTLIEMLVVLGIIAILLFVAVISLSNIREKGRDAKRISDMESLGTAMLKYAGDKGLDFTGAGCEEGALVNACEPDGELAEIFPVLRNFHDPLGQISCAENCQEPCDYAFGKLATTGFQVLFYLESGIENRDMKMPESGCYELTQDGVTKLEQNEEK